MKPRVLQTVHASAPVYRAVHEQRGFSLVEMLAALVILGLALGALYQAASGATRNARVSAEYAIATTLAESELDAFVISRPDVGMTQRGRYGDYEWERWVELIPEREESGIGWMRIVVSWSGDSQPRTVSLSTIGRLSEGAGDES
ncbi:MAG: general secretion pathway protein GspI [Alteromonadaceae bacterium]|nr:general secretion pathway protein GspI [Alteromonadaceae bacterium]